MNLRRSVSVPRRKVLLAGLGALALAAPKPHQAEARILFVRGMGGGGLASIEGGDVPRLANFSLVASAMQLPDGRAVVIGAVRWIEAGSDLRLESIEITQCIPMTTRPDGAEVRGLMSANGRGRYPFVINAIDSGLPGSGRDLIQIEVNGPAAREGTTAEPTDDEFVYEATASIVGGDFQWLIDDKDVPD